MEEQTQTNAILAVVDIVGIVVGLVSVGMIVNVLKEVGGVMGKALVLFVIGMVFQVLALIWTLVFSRLDISEPFFDIHHLLMTTGLIFFVVSSIKLVKLKQ